MFVSQTDENQPWTRRTDATRVGRTFLGETMVVVMAAIVVCASPLFAAPQPQPTSRVTVVAVDSFGTPVGKFRVIMFKDNGRDLANRFMGAVSENVPFGSYMARLQLQAGGWITRKVLVDRPDCLLILANNPFSVESAPGKAPILSGQFLPSSEPIQRPAWAKICGLYIDGCEVAELDKNDRFSFTNVIPGAYVVVVLSSSGDLITERIDIKRPDSIIVLDPTQAGRGRATVLDPP